MNKAKATAQVVEKMLKSRKLCGVGLVLGPDALPETIDATDDYFDMGFLTAALHMMNMTKLYNAGKSDCLKEYLQGWLTATTLEKDAEKNREAADEVYQTLAVEWRKKNETERIDEQDGERDN